MAARNLIRGSVPNVRTRAPRKSTRAPNAAKSSIATRQIQIPETSVQAIISQLTDADKVLTTVVMALRQQNADHDADLARVLSKHAAIPLAEEIKYLKTVLERFQESHVSRNRR